MVVIIQSCAVVMNDFHSHAMNLCDYDTIHHYIISSCALVINDISSPCSELLAINYH